MLSSGRNKRIYCLNRDPFQIQHVRSYKTRLESVYLNTYSQTLSFCFIIELACESFCQAAIWCQVYAVQSGCSVTEIGDL